MSTTGLVDTARNPYGRELTSWDANLAAQFRAMEQQGFDAREIFLQTRTWRGADGRLRQERMQRGVSSLPGYGQPTAVSEAVSGFVGAPRRFSVMDPEARKLQQARDLGEQASVASQLYGALTPFAAGATMAKAGQMGGISPLTVYHGSPHRFSKFDASKIGTGEGRQAYGYGLYFAENPFEANKYAYGIFNKPFAETLMKLSDSNDIVANTTAARFVYDDDKILGQFIKTKAPEASESQVAKIIQNSKVEYDKIKKKFGNFYTADLPDEKIAQMLDYDKPLNQQTTYVREALNKLPRDVKEYLGIGKYENLEGHKIIMPLGGLLGDKEAAAVLRKAGIPGIQYLDRASRGAKQGTRNFVVFPGEEQDIKMLKIE